MIRVLLCDDQAIVTEGLRVILRQARDIEVVGVAENGADAIEQVARHRPDVVLMDLRMPIMNGIQATAHIRQEHPATRVLVLTTYDDDGWVFDAIRAGAAGYLLKDAPRETLFEAVRATAAGGSPLAPAVAARLLGRLSPAGGAGRGTSDALTVRELEVIRLVARGASNREIARDLRISEATVKTHLLKIFERLGVADRTSAVTTAMQRGLIELPGRD